MPTEHRLFRHEGNELHLLREIVRTHQVLMTAFSRAMGMPASRFALMRVIATAESEMGVMDLAAQLGVDAAAVTRLVKEMESDGLVRRHADARDGRRNYISLSPKGEKLFRHLHGRSHELERMLVTRIGADEMTATAQVLFRLREFVEEVSKHERAKR